MQYRQLGRTNLKVSLLGLGSGGNNRLGQNKNSREDVHRLVRHALDKGINFIDSAPTYGESEVILGEALAGVPRDSYVLCTKMGAYRAKEKGELRKSVEASLRRLKTDYLDLLYFHGLPPDDYDRIIDTFYEEMREVQRDGLIRFVGASEQYETDHTHEGLQRAIREDLFDVVMIGHNLISPSGLTKVFPLAKEKNVGIVIMCAVRTILTTPSMLKETLRQWKADGYLAQDAVPDDDALAWVLGPHAATIADAAYKFAAESPVVSSVLTGTSSIEHLDENIAAILGPALPTDISRKLEDIFIPASRSVLLHHFQTR